MRPWLAAGVRKLVVAAVQLLIVLWRLSCRKRVLADPRPALRAQRKAYVYALLHEHQLAAVLVNDETRLAAMVSRSRDGDVLAAALAVTGVVAVRGSSQRDSRRKGGKEALQALIERVHGGEPALIAVDGPRGPRGQVRKGIVALARATDAVILPCAVQASRSIRLRKTWDQTLVPLPCSRVTLVFGAPFSAPGQPGDDKRACDELGVRLQSVET